MKDFLALIGTKVRVHLSWKRLGIALCGGVLALGIIVAPLYIFFFGVPDFVPERVEQMLTEGPPLSWTPGVFTYAPGNFSLHIPTNWVFVDPAGVNTSSDFGEIQFALQKTGTTCVFAYLKVDPQWPEHLVQTSVAERVFAGQAQFDSWWWVPRDSIPETFEVNFDQHVPLPNEIRINYLHYVLEQAKADDRNSAFGLFALDGGEVSEDCAYDVSRMLETLRGSYQKTTLTQNSRGYLIASAWDGTYDAHRPGQNRVAFQSDEDGMLYELFTGGMADGENVTLHGRFIYFSNGNSLYAQDVFSKAQTRLAGTFLPSDEVITDFYIAGDTLYYILGPACTYLDCEEEKNLYRVPVVGGVNDLIAEGITEGSIEGYSESKRALYLVEGFGDAGCFSTHISEFNVDERRVTAEITGGTCAEYDSEGVSTGEYEAEIARLEAFFPVDVQKVDYVSLLRVEEGRLHVPLESDPVVNRFSPGQGFRVYR